MKVIGLIAAAVLLGTGCAHDQNKPDDTTNTPPPAQDTTTSSSAGLPSDSAQASAPAPRPALICRQVGTGGSGTQQPVTAAPQK
ncbi:hypothetical protein ACLESD_47820, partial [Pyxidicoccus sp. 3LFB2]